MVKWFMDRIKNVLLFCKATFYSRKKVIYPNLLLDFSLLTFSKYSIFKTFGISILIMCLKPRE